jgi:hypothetical protein
MAGGNPNIPHIAVTTDFASTHSLLVHKACLRPPSKFTMSSLDVRPHSRTPSPSYASSIDGGSIGAPPSPTLSTQSSVHFATSVMLRENKPGDGASSLGLLKDRSVAKHGRRPSWASSGEGHGSLDGTEPNYGASAFRPYGGSHLQQRARQPSLQHICTLTISRNAHARVRAA